MTGRKRSADRSGLSLPLSDEDFALAYGESIGQTGDGHNGPGPAISYWKLFMAIVLAAPLATLLALVVIDIYPGLAEKAGLRESPAPVSKATVKAEKPAGADHTDKLIVSMKKSNAALISAIKKQVDATLKQTGAMEKQTSAIIKLADKKPQIINLRQGKTGKTGKPAPVKVIVRPVGAGLRGHTGCGRWDYRP